MRKVLSVGKELALLSKPLKEGGFSSRGLLGNIKKIILGIIALVPLSSLQEINTLINLNIIIG